MLISAYLFCLVIPWVAGAPDPGVNVDENQSRKLACRKLDGRCINKRKSCPVNKPEETEPGAPFCRRKKRCCYPAESPPAPCPLGNNSRDGGPCEIGAANCPNPIFKNKHMCLSMKGDQCNSKTNIIKFCNDHRPKDKLKTLIATVFIGLTDQNFITLPENKCKSDAWVETWLCQRDKAGGDWLRAIKEPLKINELIKEEPKWAPGICVGVHDKGVHDKEGAGHFYPDSLRCCPNFDFYQKSVCESCATKEKAADFAKERAPRDKTTFVIYNQNNKIKYIHGQKGTTNTCKMEDYAQTYKCVRIDVTTNYSCFPNDSGLCKTESLQAGNGAIQNIECKPKEVDEDAVF